MAWALVVVALAACSDDDAGVPTAPATSPVLTSVAPTVASVPTSVSRTPTTTTVPASTSTMTAPPAPTTTTTALVAVASVPVPEGVDPAVVAELQAALDAYDAAFAVASTEPADPNHPAFLDATTDGEVRRNVQALIIERQAQGQALRASADGNVFHQVLLAVEALDDARATVLTCYYDSSELYVVATGEVVDARRLTGQNRLLLVPGEDGRWRLDTGGPLDDALPVEEDPCA